MRAGITLGLLTGYVLATNGILLGASRASRPRRATAATCCGSRRARRARALVHRRHRRGRAARRLVARRARSRHARRGAAQTRPGARSASCSARCRGSSSPGSSRASSRARTRLRVVLPLGIALGALYWGSSGARPSTLRRDAAALALLRPRIRADAGAREALGRRLDDDRARRATRCAARARACRISSATVMA